MQTSQLELIPVLSSEIEITNLSKNDFVLSNKRHKHYLKISKEVKDLIAAIDGIRSVNEITAFYNTAFNSSLKADFVYNLIYIRLSKYGLLENHGKIKINGKPNYLKLSFIILNEKAVAKIAKHLHFIFNPKTAFFVLAAAFSLLAYTLYSLFGADQQFSLQASILYLTLFTLLSGIIHEFGHAAGTSFFGCRHGGIGAGFYILTPVLYADVTDIWRLSKAKRIVVNLSGIYFEIIFCTIILIFNIFIQSSLLEILAALVFIKTFANLNPLIRSDGYWVLTDLTNQPNLFRNAYGKITELLLYIFRKRKLKWNYIDLVVFAYGLLSFAFIGYFLFYILVLNPSSIIYFPKNLLIFIQNVFTAEAKVSIYEFTQLIVPLLFFYLIFNLVKNSYFKFIKNHKPAADLINS